MTAYTVAHGKGLDMVAVEKTAYALDRELRAAQELKDSWSEAFADDPDLMADMIEGETSLLETIIQVMESVDEDTILLDGIEARQSELSERKSRIKKRIETKRILVLQALIISEQKTIEAATFTITQKATPKGVIITEESDIPSCYWKAQDPKLDKAALKKALNGIEDGETITGATLDNGGVSLQIRRK